VTLAYYLDEDAMRNALLRALRAHGVDVLSAFEAGLVPRPDEEHLEFAAQHGRVLYSFNVGHFCRLHTEWLSRGKSHAGIVLAHQWRRYSIGTQFDGLLRLSMQRSAADMHNCREYLSDWV
jgi:hypothetical protein